MKILKWMVGLLVTAGIFAGTSLAEEMKGEELASKDKSNVHFKSRNGIVSPGLRLTEEEMTEWRDLKFGMFIHWGLYAIPADGEWYMWNKKMPAEEYAKFADEFNPQRFDADRWAEIARDAGMKYVVLTARHHDGFSLWDSPSSYRDFTSMKTAAKRDFVAEYVDACRKHNLKVGLFYSLLDWRFPGYFKPKELKENAQLLKEQAWGQVEELVGNYGPIDVLWYDGGWLAHQGTDVDGAWLWDSVNLNKMVRSYNPKTVINPRSGWEGDFSCNEGQESVAGEIIPFPWEKCLNLNNAGWGYNARQNLMGFEQAINMVLDVILRNGNVLLNVGPDRDGVIPASHVERLKQIGDWMKAHGESIYGTRAGPFNLTEAYGSTYQGNKVYIHARNWPEDGSPLQLPALEHKIHSSYLLHGGKVTVTQTDDAVTVDVPLVDRQLIDTVIVIVLDQNL